MRLRKRARLKQKKGVEKRDLERARERKLKREYTSL